MTKFHKKFIFNRLHKKGGGPQFVGIFIYIYGIYIGMLGDNFLREYYCLFWPRRRGPPLTTDKNFIQSCVISGLHPLSPFIYSSNKIKNTKYKK